MPSLRLPVLMVDDILLGESTDVEELHDLLEAIFDRSSLC